MSALDPQVQAALIGLLGGLVGGLVSWYIQKHKFKQEMVKAIFPRIQKACGELWEVTPHLKISDARGENTVLWRGEDGQAYLNVAAAKSLQGNIAEFFRKSDAAYIPPAIRVAIFTARDYMMTVVEENPDMADIPISNKRAKRIQDGFGWVRGLIRKTLDEIIKGELPPLR